MRTVTGVIESWQTAGTRTNMTRFKHLEVDGEPQGKPKICTGLVRVLKDKVDGECTLYISGNEVAAIEYDGRFYQRERANTALLWTLLSTFPLAIILIGIGDEAYFMGLILFPFSLVLAARSVGILAQNQPASEVYGYAKRKGFKVYEV